LSIPFGVPDVNLSRRHLLATAAAAFALPALPAFAAATKEQALSTMKKATIFMVDKVSYQGGYVWSYLPDFSRRWGEMEAFPTMIWVQPPGTATVGHVLLDAYHATGDEYYYEAAKKAADALIKIQHKAGGWNYIGDLAGEKSLKKWYDTIGKNGWRLEEFQHYYGNATFDDAGTSEASQFLLRLYVEKNDKRYKRPVEKAFQFVLDSQYPIGGWPQRYPFAKPWTKAGHRDYTRDITFNDDVAGENIEFLLMVHQALGDKRALPAIRRAMDCFVVCQQPAPQAGWGLQHDAVTLKPSGARTYEPEAYASHTTATNIGQLMNFYELTGDRKYLARIPEALDWLASIKLPDSVVSTRGRWPTFTEPGTNKPWFVHRKGSNVVNGQYYYDRDPTNTIVHYSSFRSVNIDGLRERYNRLVASNPEEISKDSPLKHGRRALPKYFSTKDISVSDLNIGVLQASGGGDDAAKTTTLVSTLNAEGWWPTPLVSTSRPYIGDGAPIPAPGDYSQTEVGDETDTSPFKTNDPRIGISTGTYVANMATMIRFLNA
jgi:hypothetical protein